MPFISSESFSLLQRKQILAKFQFQPERKNYIFFLPINGHRWRIFAGPNVINWMTWHDSCHVNAAATNAHESNVWYSCMYWAPRVNALRMKNVKKKEENHLNEWDTVSQANERRKKNHTIFYFSFVFSSIQFFSSHSTH